MNKITKFLGLVIFAIIIFTCFGVSNKAKAAEYTFGVVRVENNITLLDRINLFDTGTRIFDEVHLHIQTNDYLYLDAPKRTYFKNESYWLRNHDGWDGTQSRMYDNDDLHLGTDDFLYIDVPQTAYVQNEMYWRRNYDGWIGGLSSIYDDKDMHIATDDYLYLDAPVNIYVQNDMQISGDITATNAYLNGFLDMNYHDITNIDNAYGNLFHGDLNGSADKLDGEHGAYYLDGGNITGTISDTHITALSGGSQGDILYNDGVNWAKLPAGSSGDFLMTQGPSNDPVWFDPSLAYLPLSGGTMTGDIDMDWNDILNVSLLTGNTSSFTDTYTNDLYVDNVYNYNNPDVNYYTDIDMNNYDITNLDELTANTLNTTDLYVTNFYSPTTYFALNGDLDMQNNDIYNVDQITVTTFTDGTMAVTGGVITNAAWNGNAITDNYISALTGGSQGDILYHNGSNWTQLSAGSSGEYLMTQGASANPIWNAVSGSIPAGTINNSMLRWDSGSSAWVENTNYLVDSTGTVTNGTWNGTSIGDSYISAFSGGNQGDILYHNGSNWTQLSAGSSGRFLMTQGAGADPMWNAVSGTIPAGTINNSILRWDSGSGAWVENTNLSIDSSGTITNGTWNATVIGPTYGGTGLSSYTAGDILYASASNTLSALSAGTNGYVLTMSGGVPTWAINSSAPVTSVFGRIGVVTAQSGDYTPAQVGAEPAITSGTTAQYWRGDKTWQTFDKSAIGLGNVENTALSTWTGTTNITTLGTITSGTWNGGTIDITYGGTGQTTKTAAFNALSPTTTIGDIIYNNGTNNVRLPAGSNGQVLSLAGGIPTWINNTASPVSSVFGRIGAVTAQSGDYTPAQVGAEPAITAGTTGDYWRGDKTWQTLDKSAVGLSNVQNVDTTNASNISTGTLGDARLSANVTLQGNTFNGANQLVRLNGSSQLPAVDGSLLTGLTKIQIGLGNVENTALSTWTGSTNITTLDTISTGTWHGSTITPNYGGTGITFYSTGDLLYASDANTLTKLPISTNGKVLTIAGGNPSWQTPTSGMSNPMTTLGDIIYGAAGGTPTRLAGSAGFLKSTGSSAPTWSAVNLNSADVTGVLQVINGGTGLSASGTAGNVLTSTGSVWTSSAPVTAGDSVDAYDTQNSVSVSSIAWQDVAFIDSAKRTLNGWTYSAGGFTAPSTGEYLITYLGSYYRTGGGANMAIRLTKNGTEIPRSVLGLQFQSSNTVLAATNTIRLSLTAGDVIRFQDRSSTGSLVYRYTNNSTGSTEITASMTITRLK